jgi:hypothetical protein
MSQFIQLSPADQQRLGAAELLPWDSDVLMQREAEVLAENIPGFDPDRWFAFLLGEPVVKDGVPVLEDGKPVRRHDPQWLKAIVWCALARAGITVPFAELDFNRRGMSVVTPDDPGKDDPDQPEVATSDG